MKTTLSTIKANRIAARYGIEAKNSLSPCFSEGDLSSAKESNSSLKPFVDANARYTNPVRRRTVKTKEKPIVSMLASAAQVEAILSPTARAKQRPVAWEYWLC